MTSEQYPWSPKQFCVLILSRHRAKQMMTVRLLEKGGYTGPWYIVLGTDDATYPDYVERFGEEHIVTFDKADYADRFDMMDNFSGDRVVVYARAAAFDIARELGYDYFLMLDDDYKSLGWRKEVGASLLQREVRTQDELFAAMLQFLEDSGVATVAFGQGGDLAGGKGSLSWRRKIVRKAMNTFFCRTDAPFPFPGRINEDVNAYVQLSPMGTVMFSLMYCTVVQTQTQMQPGGLTDEYRDSGTYVKSFYSVMVNPSAVTVGEVGDSSKRIHHRINWTAVTPKILAEGWQKPRPNAREYRELQAQRLRGEFPELRSLTDSTYSERG